MQPASWCAATRGAKLVDHTDCMWALDILLKRAFSMTQAFIPIFSRPVMAFLAAKRFPHDLKCKERNAAEGIPAHHGPLFGQNFLPLAVAT